MHPVAVPQELERGDADVLERDARCAESVGAGGGGRQAARDTFMTRPLPCSASMLYVNEPKVKVDLTKYTERHTFRQPRGGEAGACARDAGR